MSDAVIKTDAVIVGAGPVGLFAVFELGLVDIDVAGGAGAGTAAFGRDAGDRVLHRSLHHGHARLSLDDVLSSVVLNKRDPCHGVGACVPSNPGRRRRA